MPMSASDFLQLAVNALTLVGAAAALYAYIRVQLALLNTRLDRLEADRLDLQHELAETRQVLRQATTQAAELKTSVDYLNHHVMRR